MNQRRSVGVPDEVTRLLCASARLHKEYAERVHDAITLKHFQAVAPPYGIDQVALVRHAIDRLRERWVRDFVLLMLWVAVPLAVLLILGGGRTELGDVQEVQVQALAAVGAVAAVLAWAVVCRELWRARRAALDLVESDQDPRSQAAAADSGLEKRLDELDRMNVVAYNHAEFYKFVGSGWWVGNWRIPPVDVTKAATDDNGHKRAVRPFDAVKLHDHVARTVRDGGLEGVRVRNRLYVQGDTAGVIDELFPGRALSPDRPRPPAPRVSSDIIQAYLLGPPDAEIRTHLCMEKIAHRQQMAVTMFFNAALHKDLLAINIDSYYLPPLQDGYWAVQALPRSRTRVFVGTALRAIGLVPGALGESLLGVYRRPLERRQRRRWERQEEKTIRRVRGYDYGASTSVREAGADLDVTKHQDYTDMEQYLDLLRHQVLEAVRVFLDDHGVDTSDFRREQSRIISNTYNFRDVFVKNGIFGPNGEIHDNTGKQQPPPGGQPADKGGAGGQSGQGGQS